MTKEIPTVIWPNESGIYRILQLDGLDDKPYLRFEDKPDDPCGAHMRVLRDFGNETGFRVNIAAPRIELPEESPYKIVGGGQCKLDLERQVASFSGGSDYYCKDVNKEQLTNIAAEVLGWTFEYEDR